MSEDRLPFLSVKSKKLQRILAAPEPMTVGVGAAEAWVGELWASGAAGDLADSCDDGSDPAFIRGSEMANAAIIGTSAKLCFGIFIAVNG